MRPSGRDSFEAGTAQKLDQLELVAALLERDVTNASALIAELGHVTAGRRLAPRGPALHTRIGGIAVTTGAAVLGFATSRRTRAAIHVTLVFIFDFVVGLAAGCVAVAAIAAALLAFAPPA